MVALEQPGCQKRCRDDQRVGRGPLSLLRRLTRGVPQDVPVQLLAVLPLAVPVPLRAPLLRAKPQQSLLTREPKRQNR